MVLVIKSEKNTLFGSFEYVFFPSLVFLFEPPNDSFATLKRIPQMN